MSYDKKALPLKMEKKIIKNKKHKEYKRSFTEKIERHNKK